MSNEPLDSPTTPDLSRFPRGALIVPIDDLREDPRNANTHNDRSQAVLMQSYSEFGQLKRVVIDGDNVVRAGSGTYRAIKALGWTHIAVTRADDLSEADLLEYAILDNRSAEFSDFDHQRLFAKLESMDIDDAIEMGFDESDMQAMHALLEAAHETTDLPPETSRSGKVKLAAIIIADVPQQLTDAVTSEVNEALEKAYEQGRLSQIYTSAAY